MTYKNTYNFLSEKNYDYLLSLLRKSADRICSFKQEAVHLNQLREENAAHLKEINRLHAHIHHQNVTIESLQNQVQMLQNQIDLLYSFHSWKITKPLRDFKKIILFLRCGWTSILTHFKKQFKENFINLLWRVYKISFVRKIVKKIFTLFPSFEKKIRKLLNVPLSSSFVERGKGEGENLGNNQEKCNFDLNRCTERSFFIYKFLAGEKS